MPFAIVFLLRTYVLPRRYRRDRGANDLPAPVFDTPEWWACIIFEKLQNFELALRRVQADCCACPSDLTTLPEMQSAEVPRPSSAPPAPDGHPEDAESRGSSEPSHHGSDVGVDDDEDGDGTAEGADESKRKKLRPGRWSQPEHVRCGTLPAGSNVEEFHRPPLRLHARNVEGKYFQTFVDSLYASQPEIDVDAIRHAERDTWSLDSQAALESFENQRGFFRSVDGFRLEPTELLTGGRRKRRDDFDVALTQARQALPQRPASTSVVMEAAFFLLEQGLLNIPDVGSVNVKQARAFLWNAAWLQQHMTAVWLADGTLSATSAEPTVEPFKNFCLAIMGAGGTGKTAALKISEALTVFFAGPETVRKLAPSNAAARLLGGDTLHALCKLPWGKARLTSKRGRLQKPTLELHRKTWRSAVAAYIDEISMVPSDQFLQSDVRFRQAKMQPDKRFGGLALNVCGDFLQLPPVDKDGTRKGLAVPLDDYGTCEVDEGKTEDEETEDSAKEAEPPSKRLRRQAHVEGRQGFALWRTITRVVCLTVNVRAPGVLSRLQAEMRAGHISDEMWAIYKSRILRERDPRLTEADSPFAKSEPCFIVHRHKIRVMRSFENAKRESLRLGVPLYLLQASDEPTRPEDAPRFTSEVAREMLRRVNPEQTKNLPSFLPLYKGMRLLLSSKDCVRFGLVKGCTCVLRDIVFSDLEQLPYTMVAGEAHQLQYMPVSLVLQAEDAHWTLPKSELPSGLPASVDRRGLFQLRVQHDYLRVVVGGEAMSVRRTAFRVMPADTITVYAAQGGTFDAVVADMQRPPNVGAAQHWLACYVMLSRARSLEGFLVLRAATREELSARPPQYLLDELERLEKLEAESLPELVAYIESLGCEVPAFVQDLLREDAPLRELQRVKTVREDDLAPKHRLQDKTRLQTSLTSVEQSPPPTLAGIAEPIVSPKPLSCIRLRPASLSSEELAAASARETKRPRPDVEPPSSTAPPPSEEPSCIRLRSASLSSEELAAASADQAKRPKPDVEPLLSTAASPSEEPTAGVESTLSTTAVSSEDPSRCAEGALGSDGGVASATMLACGAIALGIAGLTGVTAASTTVESEEASEVSRDSLAVAGFQSPDSLSAHEARERSAGAGAVVVAAASGARAPSATSAPARSLDCFGAHLPSSGVAALRARVQQRPSPYSSGASGVAPPTGTQAPVSKLGPAALGVTMQTSSAAVAAHSDASSAPSSSPTGPGSAMAASAECTEAVSTCSRGPATDGATRAPGFPVAPVVLGAGTVAPAAVTTASAAAPASFVRSAASASLDSSRSAEPLPFYHGLKPRAFFNALRERGGGGSCWLNAAVQALWAPIAIKEALFEIHRRTPARVRREVADVLTRPLRFDQALWTPGTPLSRLRARIAPAQPEEVFIAATFRAACEAPLTSALSPYVLSDYYYRGRQEDASEFVTEFLLDAAASPHLEALVRWEKVVTFRCTACDHCRVLRNDDDQRVRSERFTCLSLPLVPDEPAAEVYDTVQAAVDGYVQGELVIPDDDRPWEDPCPSCRQVDRAYRKSFQVPTPPQVLFVQLKRWNFVAQSDGSLAQRCLLHPVRATDPLMFAGIQYRLRSLVLHDGGAASAGHYIAVARHDTAGGLLRTSGACTGNM